MSTTFLQKQAPFIVPPPGKSDVTSGMQLASSGGVIGRTGAANATLSGQDIGRAPNAAYVKVTTRP